MIKKIKKIGNSKPGQEEIVGFALIIIIVAVILLIFLAFSIKNPQKESVESYEVESFIQSSLQYTSNCKDDFGYLALKDLIPACDDGKTCLDDRESCEVLNSTLRNITDVSWKIGGKESIKGYELKILADSRELLHLKKGNPTNNLKGASQQYPNSINVLFTVYY